LGGFYLLKNTNIMEEFIMARTTSDRIAAIELEMEQLANQRKELLQKQKEADNKARTNRLCKRAGLLESMLPDTIKLTAENFKTLLEMTIASNEGKELLANLLAEQDKLTAAKAAETAAVINTTAPAKPANASQNVSNSPISKQLNSQTQTV
jgi:hypothetical protein